MTPAMALQDPIFRSYLILLLLLLVSAGVVLAILQLIFKKQLGNVWRTYGSWLVMGPLVALFVLAGRVPFIIGVAVVSILSFREFARVSSLQSDRWICGAVLLGILAANVASILFGGETMVLVLSIILICAVPIFRNRSRGEVRKIALGLIGLIFFGWMFAHLGFLARTANPYGYICFIIFATEANDIAAFTCGKIGGRHLLRSEISPRKTWEGAFGALALSLALPWLLRFSFPHFGPGALILSGLIVAVGGQLGDLFFSLLKRDFGAKDMGAAIPGHGGILDRIDSLIFTAPLFLQVVRHYYPQR